MSGCESGGAARLLVQLLSSASEDAVHRHCPRCKMRRRFVHSGKFRVNAQKKRIDAWLIFRCTDCDDRWNWPIHERRPVGAIDPAELDALMRNDPGLVAHHAQAALRQSRPMDSAQTASSQAPVLTLLEPATADTRTVEIFLAVAGPGPGPRLDRLLAQALNMSRAEIDALNRSAAISVAPAIRKALRRSASDGQRISAPARRIWPQRCVGGWRLSPPPCKPRRSRRDRRCWLRESWRPRRRRGTAGKRSAFPWSPAAPDAAGCRKTPPHRRPAA